MIEAARERQGATPAATRVLSDTPGRPTAVIGQREGGRADDVGGLRRWLAARMKSLGITVGGILAVILVAFVWGKLFGDGVAVSDPIPIGKGPLRVAAGDRSVWVTSAGDGTLSRIDIATGGVSGRPLRLGRGISGVAVGEGSVWVSSPRTGEILRIDGDSGALEDRIDVGGRPGAIAFGGGRVWVADETGAGIVAINAVGGRVFKRGIAPHVAPLRLAVGAGGIWVSSAETGNVRRVDFGDALASPPIAAGRGPSGVTVTGGVVWVANSRGDNVTRVDPATRTLLGEPIAVGGRPGGIDAGTSLVWVANAADDTVSRIDIESGEVVGDPVGVGPRPGAIAVGGEAVWVANNGDGTLIRIEP
jgi:DNA-binding beta-propeller fold protein YncE